MRWADLDPQGHVNNVVYVDYLQEARVDMFRTHFRAAEAGELMEGVVVVRHEVTYLVPLEFKFKPVSIECWVTEIRAGSFTMAYEVFHELADGDRRVYVRATTLLTPFVFAAERPRRLSAEERETLSRFLEPVERRPRATVGPSRRDRVGRYPIHVRFSDVDVYGHVNNVKYFEYFQEARLLLNARLWRDVPTGTPPPSLVVAQTNVDYKVPLLFRSEPYECWSWISHVGQTSAVIESEIVDGDTLLARARVVIVFFDSQTQRAAVPPDAYREPMLAAVVGG
jgi:acyl-CoA thioester hydrolase